MKASKSEPVELTYPLRTAARLTGLSPSLLRAWERRYGVVSPIRTPGGTRRYTASDLDRLRLVKAAVDAGHRVSQVAHLDVEALARFASAPEPAADDRLDAVLSALDELEGVEAHRLLSIQLAALGPARFAREVAIPLVTEIGERWVGGSFGIASEHLATGVLRSLLGSALQPSAASLLGPRVVFGTPSGERHELGLLMAALVSMGAGANPLYLGPELPVEDLLGAVERADAAALAIGIVTLPSAQAARIVSALRGGLAEDVHLWLGGSGAGELELAPGVQRIQSLDELEQRVALLVLESGNSG